MKKHIVLATGLAVLSTSAYATKSRMTALGQDAERGSHYIKDTRSIFRNAAHVNTFKNYIVTEWGEDNDTGAAVAGDNAEGGFFREMGSFTYGLYLGSELNNQNAAKSTEDTNYLLQDNRTQLFFGGDMGVQWGANVYYAHNKAEGTFEKKNNAFGLGLGAIFGDIEGYANLDISDKSEGATNAGDKFEGDLGLDLGLSYSWNAWTFFAEYEMMGYEETVGTAGGAKTEYSSNDLSVGAGYIHEVSSTARVFSDIQFRMTDEEKKVTSQATVERKNTRLPLTFGFEADATSWLTLRGSVSQNIILGSTEGDLATAANNSKATTNANSTTVAAGGTLTFGKLMVDGSIGTTGSGATNAGQLRLDQVFTNVAVHYWF